MKIEKRHNPKNSRKEINIERKNENERKNMEVLRKVIASIQMKWNHFIKETNVLIDMLIYAIYV